jgi:N6-adenosine-specific RNA methylase IME4
VRHFATKLDEMLFMWEVNDKRRHYTDAQRAELALQMEPYLREQARQNMSIGGKTKERLTNIGKPSLNVQEELARQAGVSKGTLDKVKHIVNSELFKEDPHFREKFRSEEIRIDNDYQQVKRSDDRDKPKPKPPTGQYEILLIDPPWEYYMPGRGNPDFHYLTMSDDEIMALPIPAAENSVLFLWATNPKLDTAIETLKAWGFQYKTNLAWVKDKFGTGYYFRGQHELLLLGIKGSGLGTPAEADRTASVIFADRTREHSRKPAEVYELIETMYPGRSCIEMFARGEAREGWTVWGMETAAIIGGTAAMTTTITTDTTTVVQNNNDNPDEEEDPDLARFRKFGRPAFQNDKPKKENHWFFHRVDPRLGQKHPGQIPGQAVMNILYYYTEEGDLVVDPFAGRGSTIDACKVMERRYLAYDIKPMRPDIKEWDITKGFPEEANGCKLIYLDPPYWNLMAHLYVKESISSMSLEDFMKAMRKLAQDCYQVLKPGGEGYVALVMMPITDEKYTGKFLDIPFMCSKEFEAVGFEEAQRISMPLPFSTKSVFDVLKINMKRGLMLDTNRDLIIFRLHQHQQQKVLEKEG